MSKLRGFVKPFTYISDTTNSRTNYVSKVRSHSANVYIHRQTIMDSRSLELRRDISNDKSSVDNALLLLYWLVPCGFVLSTNIRVTFCFVRLPGFDFRVLTIEM